ncbi:MAG: polysaccharide biosynthesis protein [Hyphomicrobium sp.]|nr:polysaccharide biosynthesis protein [Hyphomicrobium sp.]
MADERSNPLIIQSTFGIRSALLDLPRYTKRTLLVGLDLVMLSLVLWAMMSLRYGEPYLPRDWTVALVLALAPVLTVGAFGYAGLYRRVTRYLGSSANMRIFACVMFAVLVWSLALFMTGLIGIPRTVVIAYASVASMVVILSRHMIGWLLTSVGIVLPKFDPRKERVVAIIYGAADAGVDAAEALHHLPDFDVVGFCDSSPSLWGQYIADLRVYRPDQLGSVINRLGVKAVLLAISPSDRTQRRMVVKDLERYPVKVRLLPSVADLASGRVGVTDLRPLDVQDLLGRDPIPPLSDLLGRNTASKSVLVTGAGGSVGSELARQVLQQLPKRLVLLDVSEPALYEIELAIRDMVNTIGDEHAVPAVTAVLGSVLDATLIKDTLTRYEIDTIYHAAAYKHVPIVERNPAVGIANNVFGTETVAKAAMDAGVERVVFISTDKAVRPTNIMGASKRLAELILQARAVSPSATVFTMVRFGNVLDSSGSVVGQFRRQIKNGGPLTVTHPEVIRYFMSIPEAAELVIQAGAMARGGEVFVLDMGEPVKIDDLARLMVRLSGLEVKDASQPDGDIEIVYTGLRPGEKLFEELLIGANTTTTEHPRILRSDEPTMTLAEVESELAKLRGAIAQRDTATIQAVLMRTVEGYKPGADVRVADGNPTAVWASPQRTLH